MQQQDAGGVLNKVRCGIVGVGGFGSVRRETLRAAGCFELLGGVDLREEAFTQAEREEAKPFKRFASVEAMAADPEIEAVFISTPANLHLSQAWVAARAGKALFVEKPLGCDLDDCRKLVEYCETNRIPHGHGFGVVRHDPLWKYVRKLLSDGVLGRVVSVSVATMRSSGLAAAPDDVRFYSKGNPGGPLFHNGIHKIDLLRLLFGEGQWLAGYVNRTITGSPTDDAYVLLGQFGTVPCTFHNHDVACRRHVMEIYGTKGGLFITESPKKLEHKITDLTSGSEPIHDITANIPPSAAESESLQDFAQSVRERRQPLVSGRDGLKALELVFDAVRVATEVR